MGWIHIWTSSLYRANTNLRSGHLFFLYPHSYHLGGCVGLGKLSQLIMAWLMLHKRCCEGSFAKLPLELRGGQLSIGKNSHFILPPRSCGSLLLLSHHSQPFFKELICLSLCTVIPLKKKKGGGGKFNIYIHHIKKLWGEKSRNEGIS